MRQGNSDRRIGRAGLVGRDKAKEVRAITRERRWLDRSDPFRPKERFGVSSILLLLISKLRYRH